MIGRRRKSPKETETTEETGKHDAVRAADPFSFTVAHRRMAWMLRLSAGTNVVLGASLVLALNTISVLTPLKTTEVALVRMHPEDKRLVTIEPIHERVQGFELVMESMARQYVTNILEIDDVTQRERFKQAFAMTDETFFRRFKRERIDSGALDDAIDSGLTRDITIEAVDRIESVPGGIYKYAVDFTQTDKRKGRIVEQKKLRAFLSMTTRPQEQIPEEDKFENPLGVTVLDMVLKTRGGA